MSHHVLQPRVLLRTAEQQAACSVHGGSRCGAEHAAGCVFGRLLETSLCQALLFNAQAGAPGSCQAGCRKLQVCCSHGKGYWATAVLLTPLPWCVPAGSVW